MVITNLVYNLLVFHDKKVTILLLALICTMLYVCLKLKKYNLYLKNDFNDMYVNIAELISVDQ